jgi:hypothetical protein
MKIDQYAFGKIVIDGKTYNSDVIIYPEKVDASWWRKEGHRLQPADLETIIRNKPDILIVGTGNVGAMDVPTETLAFLRSQGIDVRVARTEKAVEIFNSSQEENKKTVAALHLTC